MIVNIFGVDYAQQNYKILNKLKMKNEFMVSTFYSVLKLQKKTEIIRHFQARKPEITNSGPQ